jgi:hypothetical protein
MDPKISENPASQAPEPNRGWSRAVVEFADAVVVPPDTSNLRRRAGILDAHQTYRPEGAVWRFGRSLTLEPRPPVAEQTLRGRWLWCGILFDHFGHFLVESLSRFWGLAAAGRDSFDGVLFIPTRPRRQGGLLPFQRDILKALDVGLPVHIADAPTRVERLIVPGQGLGLGDMIAGTPEMRSFAQACFGGSIRPDGPRRLFITRAGVAQNDGALIGEAVLARHLARNGYEVFQPERHDVSTQISRYKAAEQIVVTDGSAAHLLAFVARSDQAIVYLARRGFWSDGPIGHIAAFSGRMPMVPSTMIAEWRPKAVKTNRGVAFALHDMTGLHRTLAAADLIDGGAEWPRLSDEYVRRFLEETGRARDLTQLQIAG